MGKTKVPPHCHLSNNWHSAKRKFHYDKDFQTEATIIKDFSVEKNPDKFSSSFIVSGFRLQIHANFTFCLLYFLFCFMRW